MAMPQPYRPGGNEFFREIPVTKSILLLWGVVFLLGLLAPSLAAALVYSPVSLLPGLLPGLATYPLFAGSVGGMITILFAALTFWWVGGSLERSWQARRFLVFLLAATAAQALVWTLGVLLVFGVPGLVAHGVLAGPWKLVGFTLIAWAFLNPEEMANIWGVLPIKSKYLGWTVAALFYFLFPWSQGIGGAAILLMGVFALGGPAVAYLYARHQQLWGWVPRAPRVKPARRVLRHPASHPLGFLLRPFQEWQRRRRVAKLQRSLIIKEDGT